MSMTLLGPGTRAGGSVVLWGDAGAQHGHCSCEELWPQSAQHRRTDRFHGEVKQRAASGVKGMRE
jgi:hypothetical protein